MNCAIENCCRDVVVTEPLPLCEVDALSIARATAEALLRESLPQPDPLLDTIRQDFTRLITAGGSPSVQQIRKTYGIDQDRALCLRSALLATPDPDDQDVRGMEAKRRQVEDATFEAAVLLSLGDAPTRKDFAAGYGRRETWGRDRYTDAERLMADVPDFAARVKAEAERRKTAS